MLRRKVEIVPLCMNTQGNCRALAEKKSFTKKATIHDTTGITYAEKKWPNLRPSNTVKYTERANTHLNCYKRLGRSWL